MTEASGISIDNPRSHQTQTKSEDRITSLSIYLGYFEGRILSSLVQAYLDDFNSKNKGLTDVGWRNKYQIHLLSGVSQKRIYNANGPIQRLLVMQYIESRRASSSWGRQKFHYRINIDALGVLMEL
ncbi:MAG: hypothetical protein P1Q69_11000, partial [Candidatus Thorarchaeota archaeon]|nr:hypothetical protein [Candidatus Thorarchaeota archaeon]